MTDSRRRKHWCITMRQRCSIRLQCGGDQLPTWVCRFSLKNLALLECVLELMSPKGRKGTKSPEGYGSMGGINETLCELDVSERRCASTCRTKPTSLSSKHSVWFFTRRHIALWGFFSGHGYSFRRRSKNSAAPPRGSVC